MRMLNDIGCDHNPTKYNHFRKNDGYRLSEPPVVDSLTVLSNLSEKENIAVVGGTAIALYCFDKIPYQRTRQTDDVDVKYKHRLTKSGFKNGIGAEIQQALHKEGYKAAAIHPISHRNYSIVVIPQDEFTEAFYITFPRTSDKYWKIREKITEKEFEGVSDRKIPEKGGRINEDGSSAEKEVKVPVVRFEDAIAPKIVLGRDKDRMDVRSALKYGPQVEIKRLEDMLYLWSGGSLENTDRLINNFKQMRAEA
jgi:uncharacterized protein (UPF0248 family)